MSVRTLDNIQPILNDLKHCNPVSLRESHWGVRLTVAGLENIGSEQTCTHWSIALVQDAYDVSLAVPGLSRT